MRLASTKLSPAFYFCIPIHLNSTLYLLLRISKHAEEAKKGATEPQAQSFCCRMHVLALLCFTTTFPRRYRWSPFSACLPHSMCSSTVDIRIALWLAGRNQHGLVEHVPAVLFFSWKLWDPDKSDTQAHTRSTVGKQSRQQVSFHLLFPFF